MNQLGYKASKPDGSPAHDLIISYNQFALDEQELLAFMSGEIAELEAESDKPLSLEWWLEFADVLVFLKSVQQRIAPSFRVEEVQMYVNGQYKGNLNSLKEQAVNLAEGNAASNLKYFITELLSMLKHLDAKSQTHIYAQVSILINKLNRKLAANKEMRFCQIEPGMNEEDILNKTTHVFRALRILRNFLKKTLGHEQALETWITDFFVSEITDWRNSVEALKRLEEKIPLFRLKIKDEVVWLLSGRATVPSQEMQIKMMLAGAIPLHSPEKKTADRAYTNTGATLGQTIFWV